MKKIINVVVLLVVFVLSVLLVFSQSKTKNNSQGSEVVYTHEAHEGFVSHEDLAYAYVDYMLKGDFDKLVGLMSKEMIVDVAVENHTTEDVVRDALAGWYRREYSYACEGDSAEILSNPESMYQRIYHIQWSDDDNLWDASYKNRDYDLGIAGYDYTGLCRLGATQVLYYTSGIFISNDRRSIEDEVGLYFTLAKINGLWYLVGVD